MHRDRDTAGHGGFAHVWDPGEHPAQRQQPEGGAAGRHEHCPELDAGGRRAGRQHGRPKVSSIPGVEETRRQPAAAHPSFTEEPAAGHEAVLMGAACPEEKIRI